jgi:hypothetical protein
MTAHKRYFQPSPDKPKPQYNALITHPAPLGHLMSNGKIIQIIGAVIDVEFSEGNIPSIYNALIVNETGLTLEVQQQLGDNVFIISGGRTMNLPLGFWVNITCIINRLA